MPFTSSYFSSAPGNNTQLLESNETLVASATRLSSQSTIVVTRTSGTVLSIANGASSSARQYVRFDPQTRAVTAALTLTLTAGTGTGAVSIYAELTAAGALVIFAMDTSGNTFTLTGTGSFVVLANGFTPPPFAVLLYTWTITAGAFDSSGGTDAATPTDCWVDSVNLANTTSGSVTVTLTDAQTSPLYALDAVAIPANSTSLVVWPGGKYFEGGALLQCSAANSIDCNFRLVRLRRAQLNP